MPKKIAHRKDGVYERPDATGYWGSWTDANGRRRRRRLNVPTFQAAKSAVEAEKLKVEKQIAFGEPTPSEDSFSMFAVEFLKHQKKLIVPKVVKGKISQATYTRQAGIVEQHLKPFFGEMKLATIRRKNVSAYINSRMGETSDASIIKEVNTLKRLFNIAIEDEKIFVNPAQRIPLPRAPEGRSRYLTIEQWGSVFNACYFPPDKNGNEQEQWLQHAAGLAVSLGTRRGELLNVTLPDINLDTRIIVLRKTKNGKPRPAFINDLAMQVLESMGVRELKRKHKNRGLLFPDVTPAALSVAFIRACQRAEVEDFSFHDLRHTFASHLRMNGADLHDLQTMLGHSDPRMTNCYVHLSNEHLDKTAQRLNGVLTLPARAVGEEIGATD